MNVTFIWTLTRDPEVWTTKTTWNTVTKVSVAVNTNPRYNESTSKYEYDVSYYNIEAYKKTAEKLAKYPKGTSIYIDWDLSNVSYKNSEGKSLSYLKVISFQVMPIKFLKEDEITWSNSIWVAPTPVTSTPVQPTSNVSTPFMSDDWLNFDFSGV